MLEISEELSDVHSILVDMVLNQTMGTILKEHLNVDLDKCSSSSSFHCWYYRWCNIMATLAGFLVVKDITQIRFCLVDYLKTLRYTTTSIMTEDCINFPNILLVSLS